ncbi:MAG: EthD family reductase [Acetobacteraceae bacterium]
MIAAISLMRRQDAVTLNRFRRHWIDIHGPLVCAFAGLRHYVQCHVIASPAMNERARAMRIDGFPILYFLNDTDRSAAHGSPEMAACNVDSRQFVGAVSRVITDVPTDQLPSDRQRQVSLMVLYPDGTDAGTIEAEDIRLESLPLMRGLMRYQVREQGAAPASTVPHLPVTVAAVTQARFDSLVDLEAALETWTDTAGARFVVEEHWFV